MVIQKPGDSYKDRTLILKVIGGVLLLIGAVAAYFGPIEMYCFYLFSEGGRFHYEGFGFGSFMFGNLACQIMGYYLIAIVLIPLGYGHLKARRWSRILTLALLWFWIIVGIPLTLAFAFIWFTAKDLPPATGIAAFVLLCLSYFVIPPVGIRFYNSRDVLRTFEQREPAPCSIEHLPLSILVMVILFAFYAVALHALIFFNGLFPMLGAWVNGLQGITTIDIALLCLTVLTWGTLTRQKWAWWGTLVYFSWLTLSWTLTLMRSSWLDMLAALEFPPYEMEILERLPFRGSHFAVLVGIPFVLTLGLILQSWSHFQGREKH
ncbi:MAG: hypothetical protein RBT47_07245 [Anaerolineae bacterium]|jgi:hypothetical protein|nr:hypothetical protein [Anaerolineae bacterium]